MKRLILTMAGVMILFAITFVACQKESFNTVTPSGHSIHLLRGSLADNPMDSIGDNHNKCLDAVTTVSGFPSESVLKDEDAIDSALSWKSGTCSDYHKDIDSTLTALKHTTLDSVAIFMRSKNFISLTCESFIMDLSSKINSAKENGSVLLSSVSNFEDSIYVNTNLTTNEKTLLYSGAAILKSSCTYWTNAANDIHSPWHNIGGPDKMPRWLADIKGFFEGASGILMSQGTNSTWGMVVIAGLAGAAGESIAAGK